MTFYEYIKDTKSTNSDAVASVIKQLGDKMGLIDPYYIKLDSRGDNAKHQINYVADKHSKSTRVEYSFVSSLAESAKETNFGLIKPKLKEVIISEQLSIAEIVTDTAIEITIKVISKSETDITSIVDRLNNMALASTTENYHVILVTYPVPVVTNDFLALVRGTGAKLQYRSTNMVTDVVGESLTTAIRYDLSDISGRYTTDQFDMRSDSVNTEENEYSVDLTYRFIYPKPVSLSTTYNLVIHNTYLDSRRLIKQSILPAVKIPEVFTNIEKILGTTAITFGWNDDRIVIPAEDNLNKLPTPTKSLSPLSSVLVTTEGNLLLDLLDLGDYKFDNFIIDLVASAQDRIFNMHESLLYVRATVQDTVVSEQKTASVRIDGTKIYLNTEPNINSVYRLHFFLINTVAYLSEEAKAEYYEYYNYINTKVLYHVDMEQFNITTPYELYSHYDVFYRDTDDVSYSLIEERLIQLIVDSLTTLKDLFPDVYTDLLDRIDSSLPQEEIDRELAKLFLAYFYLTEDDIIQIQSNDNIYKFITDSNVIYFDLDTNYIDIALNRDSTNGELAITIGNRGSGTYLISDDILHGNDDTYIVPIFTPGSILAIEQENNTSQMKTVMHSCITVTALRKDSTCQLLETR